MKIARLIARLNIGGPAIQAVSLTQSLQALGHTTWLLTGDVPPGETSAAHLVANAGIEVVKIQGLSRAVSPADDLRALAQIISFLRRHRPDIVHTHTAKAGALGRVAARLCGIPAVHTFHGHVFSGYFSRPKTAAAIATERMLARMSRAIIAISDSQKQDLCDAYRIAPAAKVHVIPLGFDLAPLAQVYRQKLHQPWREPPRAGWVGRLTAIKDPAMFPAVARCILDRCPTSAGSFTMFGDGELRSVTTAAAAALAIGDRVRLAGWETEPASIFDNLDVLFLTSRNEGTPVAVIEAMASGCAVIAAGVGGVGDLLGPPLAAGDGYSLRTRGALVHNRTPAAFAAAYADLFSDPSRLRGIIAAAHDHAVRAFAKDRLVHDLLALYAGVLANPDRN